jgi:ABC-type dipeptide/oligopeptide/nickel transport system ATPase component
MTGESDQVILDARNLSVIYSSYGSEKRAIDSISFKLMKGEILGIVGESGAGKSTIAKAIMGIIDPPSYATGEIIYNNKNIIGMKDYRLNRIRWNKITMIFQASMNSLNPVQSVASNFISVLRDKMNITDKGESERKIDEVLKYVNLPLYVKENFPHELSGGMRQRILIALAMITNPEIVIADEPTTALDIITEFYVLSILKRNLQRSGSSMIYITHDLPSVIFLADRMLVMKDGTIVEQGKINEIINNPKNDYTRKLVSTLNEVIE